LTLGGKAIPNMKPAKAGQPYSAAINHVIVGQVLHSPALNEGHVLVNPPYLELLLRKGSIFRQIEYDRSNSNPSEVGAVRVPTKRATSSLSIPTDHLD